MRIAFGHRGEALSGAFGCQRPLQGAVGQAFRGDDGALAVAQGNVAQPQTITPLILVGRRQHTLDHGTAHAAQAELDQGNCLHHTRRGG